MSARTLPGWLRVAIRVRFGRRATRSVGTPNPRDRDPRATLLALAERAPSVDEIDHYGEGGLAERLEARIATLLGKEAAVWMPSGTMAQQIALRLHSERRGHQPGCVPPALPP